ncbi:MAG: HAMP domain-containing protein, partial [Anaerolineae bacterium]|nr:HAMP domain-containing protein [Anaerolineae bacterium]
FLFSSLERKFIFALVFIGIVPLVLVVAITFLRSRTALEDAAKDELEIIAALTNDRVSSWLLAREADAKAYASLEFPTGEGSNPQNRLQSVLESAGQTYSAVYLTDENGQVIGQAHTDAGTPEVESFAGTEIFTRARENGVYRSPITADNPLNVTTIFISHRASSGVIILQVNPTEIQNLVSEFADGDGQTFIQNGGFLITPEGMIELRSAPKNPSSGVGVGNLDGLGEFDDETVLSSWHGNEALDYVVFAQIPRGVAFSATNSLLLVLVIVAIVFMALVFAAAYWFSQRISRPIVKLTTFARDIARGTMTTSQAEIQSKDEIGLLAGAFNEMTDRLRVRVYDETQNREYLEDVLTSYMKFVERVSRGDLTARLSLNGQTGPNLIVANVRVDQDDNLLRLGYNLNRMVEALHSMASQTRDVAGSLAEAALEILESSNKQISNTTQQDASVSQTTSTVSELRATVAETAERAQMVAEAAQQSVEISRQGQVSVAETIEGMNLIRSRVESIAQNILMLSERTTQIGDIIATVNAIADQSKMLALNASIEAARAGEEGRGFAVVAMEVRNLAEQSREATAQVRDILSEIQQATNTAVMVTEEGTKGVDLGV